jgi:hypothetical protein
MQVRFRLLIQSRLQCRMHFTMPDRVAVVADEALEREREQTVDAGVHESSWLAGLLS